MLLVYVYTYHYTFKFCSKVRLTILKLDVSTLQISLHNKQIDKHTKLLVFEGLNDFKNSKFTIQKK